MTRAIPGIVVCIHTEFIVLINSDAESRSGSGSGGDGDDAGNAGNQHNSEQQRRQQITISVPPDFKKDINLFRNFNYRRTLMFILQLKLSEANVSCKGATALKWYIAFVGTRYANSNKWDKFCRAYRMHENDFFFLVRAQKKIIFSECNFPRAPSVAITSFYDRNVEKISNDFFFSVAMSFDDSR